MAKVSYELANKIMKEATRESIRPTIPHGLNKQQTFYWRIKNDFTWFAESFLKIRDKNANLVPFRINEAQIKVEALDKYCRDNKIMRRYIILKARQMGMSTYTEGKIYHETSTDTFINSMIIAHEDKATQNLFNMSKLYYEEMPELIKPMKRYSNEKALGFENPTNDDMEKRKNPGLRSKITVHTANTIEAGRSSTTHKLHTSELAFFPNASTTMLGLLQSVPDTLDTLVVLETTANGVGGYFHDLWQRAMRGENSFIPIFLPWFTDSTYTMAFETDAEREEFVKQVDQISKNNKGEEIRTYEWELMNKFDLTYEQLNWRRWAIQNKCNSDEESFCQEYPSTPEEAFISTGRPRFNISSLRKYATQTCKPLKRGYLREKNGHVYLEEDDKGYVMIWEEPQAEEYYCIGADVAEGTIDGDYSVGLVGDNKFNVVASWYGHIDPDLFGEELVKLGKYYNEAYIAVEANNHGLTTLKAIQRNEYYNIYYQKTYDKISDTISKKMGWTTSIRTKPLMIDKLAEFIREKYLGIKWDTIISEGYTYIIEENGSTNAQVGCHDDTIMALAILLQVLLEGKGETYVPEVPNEKRKRKSLEKEFGKNSDDEEEKIECT